MCLSVISKRTCCGWRRNRTEVAKTLVQGRLCKQVTTAADQHEGPAAPDSVKTKGQQQEHTASCSEQPEGVSIPANAAAQQQQQQHLHATDTRREEPPEQRPQTSVRGSRLQAVQGFIQQYGTGAFLSFITVSNIVSVVMLSCAWVLFTKTTGATPLAQGQWPKFLMFYGGAYAVQHIARPLKMAVGLAGASLGAAAVDGFADMLGVGKNVALVVLLAIEAVLLLCCLGCVAMYANRMVAAAAAVVAR